MRSTVMTPKQVRQWCNAELAKHERGVHRAELDYANNQYQTATHTGDCNRACFWSAVKHRASRGERLSGSMNAEHRTHNGPFKPVMLWGEWRPMPDLDHWRLG